MKRLEQQIQFIVELDKLKEVYRQSYLISSRRHENSAEHSWHVATMAIVLREYANNDIDVNRVLKMLLLHDIIEIDAGDTYVYDDKAINDKAQREKEAANRLFALLPQDQATEYRSLWDEYENRETAEARFALAIDRLMPLLHNYYTQGKSWQEHNINKEQVLRIISAIRNGSEELWHFAQEIINDAVSKGYLRDS